jgi:hypothetical protein
MAEPSEKLPHIARENFARHYASFGKVGAAAKAAHINPNTGTKWLKEPDVIARVEWWQDQDWQEEAAIRRDCGVVFVLSQMRDMILDEEVENPVKANLLHKLGLECGLFRDKEETAKNEGAVKVFFGVDPSKIGLDPQQTERPTEAKANSLSSDEAIGKDESEAEERPQVIPMSHPKKTIVLPGGGK